MHSKTNGAGSLSNGHTDHRFLPALSTAMTQASAAMPGMAPPPRHQEVPAPLSRRTPTLSDSSVGREIRALRRAQGRTQKELARAIGVTGAQLHRYEAGTTRIAASRLITIAEALGVAAETLIAAGYGPPAGPHAQPAAPVPAQPSDDIVELIELFGTITDARHRSALVAVARMMALQYSHEAPQPEG